MAIWRSPCTMRRSISLGSPSPDTWGPNVIRSDPWMYSGGTEMADSTWDGNTARDVQALPPETRRPNSSHFRTNSCRSAFLIQKLTWWGARVGPGGGPVGRIVPCRMNGARAFQTVALHVRYCSRRTGRSRWFVAYFKARAVAIAAPTASVPGQGRRFLLLRTKTQHRCMVHRNRRLQPLLLFTAEQKWLDDPAVRLLIPNGAAVCLSSTFKKNSRM